MKYRARYWMVRVQKIIAQFKSANPRVRLLAHSTLTVLGLLLAVIVARVMLETNSQQSVFNAQDRIVGVLQIILLAALPLAIIAYLAVDYVSHRKSLLQGKARIIHGYSVAHHIKVVNIPLFRYRFKDSIAAVAISLVYLCGFSGFLGYMIVKNSTASFTPLGVSINQEYFVADPNPSYVSLFRVNFSEPIDRNSFTLDDIMLGGTAEGQQVQSITEDGDYDGTRFQVRIQAASAGTIQPTIEGGVIHAAADVENLNYESTTYDNSITYTGAHGPDEFVIRFNGNTFKTAVHGEGFNYSVDCESDDEIDFINQTGVVECNYDSYAFHSVSITGTFPRFRMSEFTTSTFETQIVQWGNMQWDTMESALQNTKVAVTATDAPNLSQVSNMSYAFSDNAPDPLYSGQRHQTFNHWNVGNVTNMQDMFSMWSNYNLSLNNWDVSSVTNMSHMFGHASSFNQPLNNWDVSSVTDMSHMFRRANSFNQPLNNWDVSSVTDMSYMFDYASSFNQPLNNWDVSSVTAIRAMFQYAQAFNQSLGDWGSVSKITDKSWMLNYSGLSPQNYDSTLVGWSTSEPAQYGWFGAVGVTYCTAEEARNILINAGWNIEDGGIDRECQNQPPLNSLPFIMKIDTTLGDGMNSFSVFGNYYNGYRYNFSVDCNNDGTLEHVNSTATVTCSYATPGQYEVAIHGDYPHWGSYNVSTNQHKIIDVMQWGGIRWRSMEYMFAKTPNISIFSAADAPDLRGVTDMTAMFSEASNFNSPVNHWDVSNVTKMYGLFGSVWSYSAHSAFNQPLNDWDVSNVTDMTRMFYSAHSFNQPLNNWDVSNVTKMNQMFAMAISFNQPLNDWELDSIQQMYSIFFSAINFDQPLGSWSINGISELSLFGSTLTSHLRYYENYVYNVPLNQWTQEQKDTFFDPYSIIAGQNIDEANFELLVSGLSTQNYDSTLAAWNQGTPQNEVSLDAGSSTYCESYAERNSLINDYSWSIQDRGPADGCEAIPVERPLIVKVDTSALGYNANGPDASSRFRIPHTGDGTYTVDCDNDGTPEHVNVSTPVTCSYQDYGIYDVAISGQYQHYDGEVNESDNQKIIDVVQWGDIEWSSMDHMFYRNHNIQTITAEDTPDLKNVTSMMSMFEGASAFNGDISDWNVSSVTNMMQMFSRATSFNQPLNNWDVGNVTNMYGIFTAAESFNQPLNNWDVGNVTNMASMFNTATAFNQPLNDWNVGNVTNFDYTFARAVSFNSSLTGWSLDNAVSTRGMFMVALKFNQSIGDWNVSNVTDMMQMFALAYDFNQPLNDWDVGNVTNMMQMFAWAPSFNRPLNNWDVGNVTNMALMFSNELALSHLSIEREQGPLVIYDIEVPYESATFNQPLNNWDVSNVNNMAGMFYGAASFNRPLNDWDVSGVTNMGGMFLVATSFNQPLNNWDVSNVEWFTISGIAGAVTGEIPSPDDLEETILNFGMFAFARSFNSSVAGWNLESAQSLSGMFLGATAFNQPLTSWNTSNITSMTGMFSMAQSFDQNLSNLDIQNVNDMRGMFVGLDSIVLDYNLVDPDDSPESGQEFLYEWLSDLLGQSISESNSHLLVGGLSTPKYDSTLSSWSMQSLQEDVIFDAGNSIYCSAELERQSIIDDFSWTINDQGKDCSTPQPALTDMSLSTSITVPSRIQKNDRLSYNIVITNLGPNTTSLQDIANNALIAILPENTTFVSAVGTPAVLCEERPVTGSGVPFEGLYAGRTMVACAWNSSNQSLSVNSSMQIGLVLEATANITSGSNVILSSLLIWENDIDMANMLAALENGQDAFKMSYNNVSRYTLSVNDDAPTSPTNPTNPGTNVFDEGTTDDTIDIPTVEDIFRPDYNLDKPAASTPAKATWPTNVPFFFISLLVLVALFYTYLALRDYMRARAALLLLARIKRDKDNILTFLEIISHYLGTPLSVLSGATELLTTKNVLAATTLTSLTAQINSLRTVVTTTTVNNNALLEQPTGGSIDGSDTSQILKSRQIWLPLVTIAGLIIIVDVSLMIFGGYELASLRTANVALFYILSAVGIVLTSYIMLKQKQLAERRALVIQQEQQLTTQQQSILSDVALQIQALYSKLYTSSQEFLGVAGTELYFNGLAMLGKLSRSLTNASTFAGPSVNPSLQPLSTVVRDVCTELQPLTDSKNINITSNVPDSLGIYASQDEARFLVWSLLENAVNFSPQSGSVNVTAVAGGNTIKLSVTDHGPGIPSDKIEDIFKPFMRASDTKEFDHEGLGLGLYTNKLLVEKLGGTLTITSSTTADTSGTTATLTLPKASQDGQGMSSSLIAPQTS